MVETVFPPSNKPDAVVSRGLDGLESILRMPPDENFDFGLSRGYRLKTRLERDPQLQDHYMKIQKMHLALDPNYKVIAVSWGQYSSLVKGFSRASSASIHKERSGQTLEFGMMSVDAPHPAGFARPRELAKFAEDFMESDLREKIISASIDGIPIRLQMRKVYASSNSCYTCHSDQDKGAPLGVVGYALVRKPSTGK